jgi:putative transposase
MAGKRRTPEEISYVLAQAKAGVPIKELCRKYGVAEATFYARRRSRAGFQSIRALRVRD